MQTIAVRNPRTGAHDYEFQQIDAATLQQLAGKMRDAQHNWQAFGAERRCAALLKLADAIEENCDSLYQAVCIDTGRSRESDLEVSVVISSIRRWCRMAPELLATQPAKTTSIPFIDVGKQLVPYPLVAAITPWNFPLLLSFIDVIPALLAGCAVIVKPSEVTPGFIEPLNKCIKTIPELEAVLRFLPGDGFLGSEIINQVDLVCFTGSVATGKKVALAAAARFIPCELELGGKDPAIVTANTDIERAAAALCWGGMANAGQSCLSIERIYVESPVYDDFISAIVERAGALKLNTDNIDEGEIGPVIFAKQCEIINRHLMDAKEKGAKAECGGALVEHNGGTWCQPTILSHVDHSMLVLTEETFAPILPVMSFDTEEQAIELANDTIYGLSAAVFSSDTAQARRIASDLDAGGISINDAALTAMMHEGEKQAFKLSGMGGSRMGPSSIQRFLRSKALIENTGQVWDPWWFERN